jgi:hypothetical protein
VESARFLTQLGLHTCQFSERIHPHNLSDYAGMCEGQRCRPLGGGGAAAAHVQVPATVARSSNVPG